jgi:hypothetical protein
MECLIWITRDWAEQVGGPAMSAILPLATVGPKKAACRDGPEAEMREFLSFVQPGG